MLPNALVLVDDTATILEVDDRFCALMRSARERLLGTYMLAITAPDDRETCFDLFGQLRRDGRPVTVVKRLIRGDGTLVWTTNHLSAAAPVDGARRFLFEIAESGAALPAANPADLLRVARVIRLARRRRSALFDADLFADHSWDMLLSAYITEAEGGLFSIADVHAELGIGLNQASRWVRALAGCGLVEVDGDHRGLVTAPLRLTASGHARLERYFTELLGAVDAPAAVPA